MTRRRTTTTGRRLPQTSKEGKNDPIYNAHSYHTKVPPRGIIPYILHYTRPGDLILDPFCGSGMTGGFSPRFEQATPYNTVVSLRLGDRKRGRVSAYILRKLLAVGKGVPNALRIAACRSSGVGKRVTAVSWTW